MGSFSQETGCADGSFEDPMIIFKSEGISEGWVENEKFAIPDGVMVGYSPNGWTDNEKAMAFIKHFFGPGSKTAQKANGQFRMLLFDGHSSHIHWQFLQYALQQRVIPFCLPPHTLHCLQPLDVAVYSPYKQWYGDQIWNRFQWGDHGIMKDNFWSILQPAREAALIPQNIKSGFRATGIYPYDPDRILLHMPGYDSYHPSTPLQLHSTLQPPLITPETACEIESIRHLALSNVP
ncbi:DDE-domain-containing protein [Choiromyces venosus 120613-1]|uniref:DDE-domain-containing protein n=1 Tax=Choiromyces venosus 120613-1 TaxID=1336337 RepID=A0A3N4JNR9_9PEZI|nr:DDE-domain-containing protein [Choiromyces venosus 120613-1]